MSRKTADTAAGGPERDKKAPQRLNEATTSRHDNLHSNQGSPTNAWIPDLSAMAATIWLVLSLISLLFLRHAPEAYMDEPFHVTQTQQYCQGSFAEWDPKITTFPGLYIVGATIGVAINRISKLLPIQSKIDLCSVQILRNINGAFGPVICILAFQLYRRIHQKANQAFAAKMALLILLIPTSFFYTFLYYTDMGALASVLMTLLAAKEGRYVVAGFAGAVSVLFRQTNAIWVSFVLADSILRMLVSNPILKEPNEKYSLSQQIVAAIRLSLRNWRLLISRLWPLASVPVIFAGFVLWNKGIVVGDRSNHVPKLHLMQPFYFVMFSSLVLNQIHFVPSRFQRAAQDLSIALKRKPKEALKKAAMAFIFSFYIVRNFTLAHPFLLADNRHYTFYLWKDIIAAYPMAKFCLIPLYIYAFWSVGDSLRLGGRLEIWILIFWIGTSLALAPAWLIEFRYFTVPLVLLILFMKPPDSGQLLRTLMLFILVNTATIYVFLFRPFSWPDGSLARFMW